jgi:hypothetical protein
VIAEEAAEDLQAVAGADARQARMIRQGFVQVVAQEPPHAEPVGRQAQELAFGANALKEHHELQAKEDPRISAWQS